jgi:hypothetical protein
MGDFSSVICLLYLIKYVQSAFSGKKKLYI